MLVDGLPWLVLAYLVGSVPNAYLLGRWLVGVDIRQVGDGNVGARNLARQAGFQAGVAAALLDGLKGYGTLALLSVLGAPTELLPLAALAAVLGHDFPLYLRGVGGQGMATTLGALLYLAPLPTLICLAVFGGLWLLTRSFDPSMAVGMVTLPVTLRASGQPALAVYVVPLLVLIGLKKLFDLPRARAMRARDGAGEEPPPG